MCPPFPQLSLLFSMLGKPYCFSISSYILSSTCLTIVMEFHCTPFNLLLSVLFWTAHNWIQDSSCCLTNHILQLSGQTFTDTAQDAVAFLCSRDTLLTWVQVDVHQDCKVYCWKTISIQSAPILTVSQCLSTPGEGVNTCFFWTSLSFFSHFYLDNIVHSPHI